MDASGRYTQLRHRAISGPQRSQLVSLPDSQKEVKTIATDLPHPSTILLGSDATESRFKHLPLSSTEVVHLLKICHKVQISETVKAAQ